MADSEREDQRLRGYGPIHSGPICYRVTWVVRERPLIYNLPTYLSSIEVVLIVGITVGRPTKLST